MENITDTLTNTPTGKWRYQIQESSVCINTNYSFNKLCMDKKNLLILSVLYPGFSDLINKYDLFCVCKTKIDKYDDINVPGYVFLRNWCFC